MSTKVPIVAIVGRANVGKSSLFNSFLGRREAIVAVEPGTTRDNVTAKASIDAKDFWLVDSAGLKDPEDDFELGIQQQITEAAAAADLILVVVSAEVPITAEDRQVATLALKTRKPVILVVNKIDKLREFELEAWQKLGIKIVLPTSITQRRGIEELKQTLAEHLPRKSIDDHKGVTLAILGRPNVGKSALFNSLAKKQQALVSSRAGTTRDVNRTRVNYEKQAIDLLDTAGIRRNVKVERGAEHFSVLRSLAAIEEADVCLVLIDVNELGVQLDQKIAGMCKDAGKGLILVISKWDSIEKNGFTHDQLARQVTQEFVFIPWAPLIFTSAVTGQNVARIYEMVIEVAQARTTKVKTVELNRWLGRAIQEHPPAGLKNRQPKLNYMVQEEGDDPPSFRIFGGHTKFLHWSYKRYLERSFRERWPFIGTPIKFWFIEKH